MTGPAPTRLCPICGRRADGHYKPFCSLRCSNVDLARWLNECYRIPAKPETEDEADSSGHEEPENGG